jgi:putative membrane protein
MHHGFGFFPFFIFIPFFWIAVIVTLAIVFGRRRRAMWGYWREHGTTSPAEQTLAQRYANGDIDEQEYRARLEVLRANRPQAPFGPGSRP